MDHDIELLFLGSMSWDRPASAKVGWPVLWAIRPPATASRCYKRLSRLLDELAVARLHGRQARMLKTMARTRLLILDDWAMVIRPPDS
jgi:hypothetical protein